MCLNSLIQSLPIVLNTLKLYYNIKNIIILIKIILIINNNKNKNNYNNTYLAFAVISDLFLV